MGLCQAVNDHRQGAPIPMSHRQGRAPPTPCPVKDPGAAPAGHWGTLAVLWQQDTGSVTRVERQQPPITSCCLASAPPPPNDQALGGATSSAGPRSQSPWNTALFMEGAPHTPIQCSQLQHSPTTILPHHTTPVLARPSLSPGHGTAQSETAGAGDLARKPVGIRAMIQCPCHGGGQHGKRQRPPLSSAPSLKFHRHLVRTGEAAAALPQGCPRCSSPPPSSGDTLA